MDVENEALDQLEKAIVLIGHNMGHAMTTLDTLRGHADPELRGAYSAIHDLMGDLASVLIAAGVVRLVNEKERESEDVRLPLAS